MPVAARIVCVVSPRALRMHIAECLLVERHRRLGRALGLSSTSPAEEWAEGWEAAVVLTDTVQVIYFMSCFLSRLPAEQFARLPRRLRILVPDTQSAVLRRRYIRPQASLYGIIDAFGGELRSLRLPAPAFGDAKARDALLATMLQYQG